MKKKNKKAQLPFRLNILFFVVFLLFSVLIIQLGVVQILNGETYQEEIDKTIQDTTKIPVPRGKILDRNHQVIVDNKPLYSITYTPPKGVQAQDKLDLAEDLENYMSMDEEAIDKLNLRNKKEYWYLKNTEEAEGRVTKEEAEEMDNAEHYQTVLDRITEEEVSHYSKEELEVIAIKKELDKAFTLTPQVIKNENISAEEYARIAEHLDQLPGINATTDWDREYPFGDTFYTFLGSITSQEQGILAEKEDYYLTRGYSRNDRVGRSGLEAQYEDLLRGRKEQIQYTTNKSGKVIDSEVIVPGERGKDLILTIDMEYQEIVDNIVRKELDTTIKKHPHANRFLEDALVVVMNPKTGEILAVSGQHYNREDKKYENAAFKAVYDAHRPGSTVKGATVLAGYQSGVISPGQVFHDTTIKIADTPPKGSYLNLGPVNDYDALRRSSNVYMFYIALRMGGEYRHPIPRDTKVSFQRDSFQEMRNYFGQFGLGVKTGIDYPYESTGYVGTELQAGKLMDFAIGQFDTYTTMQLAQYVATIANDGYRVRPHFLKEVRLPTPYENEIGSLYQSVQTKVLNRIEMDDQLIKRVQEGFRQVFNSPGGTGTGHWSNKDYQAVGKTGTAENEVYPNKDNEPAKVDTENRSLVGYAPFDDPEVAFAVIVPNMGKVSGQHEINHTIGTGILDAYFKLKEERESGKQAKGDGEEEQEETE